MFHVKHQSKHTTTPQSHQKPSKTHILKQKTEPHPIYSGMFHVKRSKHPTTVENNVKQLSFALRIVYLQHFIIATI